MCSAEVNLHAIAISLLASLLATVDAGVVGSRPASGDEVAETAESRPPAKAAAEPRLPASAFATERQPRARRTQKWTRPRRGFSPRWESDYPRRTSLTFSIWRDPISTRRRFAPRPSANGWRLSGGTASFELGCSDAMEAPEVFCRLELELDDGLVLGYAPRNPMSGPQPDITLWRHGDAQRQSLGEIQFERTYSGTPVVIISGRARAEKD